MKATWNDTVIAEAPREDLIYIEQNWYFPPSSINMDYLQRSDTQYTCPWKGDAQYYNVGTEGNFSDDNAWSYDSPIQSAKDRVKKDFSGYIAFWRDVSVSE